MKLEFEIKNSDTKNNLLYMDPIENTDKPIKYNNKTYTIYIDTRMSNAISGSDALYNDNITIYNLLLKNQSDTMTRD